MALKIIDEAGNEVEVSPERRAEIEEIYYMQKELVRLMRLILGIDQPEDENGKTDQNNAK